MLKNLLILSLALSFSLANIAEISLLRGDANITRQSKNIKAKLNMKLFDKDIINTNTNTRMQIIFSDETVITLGSETKFEVQSFSQEKDKQKAIFSITKGAFKIITGQIGKIAPDEFKIKTQNSYIGIRGTIFAGEINKDKKIGDFISCLDGQITVTSIKTNKKITLLAGQMVHVIENKLNHKNIDIKNFSILNEYNLKDTNEIKLKYEEKTPDIQQNSQKIPLNNNYNNDFQENFQNNSLNTNLSDIQRYIKNNIKANYQGKLKGVSVGEYQTSQTNTKINSNIKANMSLKVDFGGNEKALLDITNQQVDVTSAMINGKQITGQKLENIKTSVANETKNFNLQRKLSTNINPNTKNIVATDTKVSNNITSTINLNGNFKGTNLKQLQGNLQEKMRGNTAGVSLKKDIKATFELEKK